MRVWRVLADGSEGSVVIFIKNDKSHDILSLAVAWVYVYANAHVLNRGCAYIDRQL